MRTINLTAVPNQEFSVTLDGNRWDMTIKEACGCMLITLALNEVTILTNQRIVAEAPIIPYKYLQGSGNFAILCDDEDIPYYDQFGITQSMIYVSPGEQL